MKKLERISRILIFVGFGIALLNNSVLGGSQTIGLIGMVFSVCSFSVYLYAKEKRKKQEKDNDKQPLKDEKSKEPNKELQKNNEDNASNNIGNKFDSLMTGQLVAFYKITHIKDYSDEYERRLQHIGFTEPESKSLFMLELMMLKHDHITILTDENYLNKNYFDLKTPILPLENSYYVEHQTFLVSEITKIWDEAEWVWTCKKNEEMPKDVANEIFMLTRYGGGELLVETLKSIAEHSHVDIAKIQKYSVSEQDMMFKYKWNKNANEKHPYI